MSENTYLFLKNVAVWCGVFFTFMIKMLPLIQSFAGLFAIIFTLMSIVKLFLEFLDKIEKYLEKRRRKK